MNFDLNGVAADVLAAVKGVVEKDWSKASSFARQQSKLLARQAQLVAAVGVSGEVDEAGFKFACTRLAEQTREFALTLVNLALTTIEKAFNAAIGVLWKAIGGALNGVGLGDLLPKLPKP